MRIRLRLFEILQADARTREENSLKFLYISEMLIIMILISGCATPTPPTATPSQFTTPLPPEVQTRIAKTRTPPTLTPEPSATPSLTPSATIPYPTYDLPADLLLDECYPPVEAGTLIPWWFKACDEFTTSVDGRYLAYEVDPESCGRNLVIIDMDSGESIYRTETFGVHKFEFLPNGQLLLGKGHCEGGGISLLDPTTLEFTYLGIEGKYHWNPQHTAFAVNWAPFWGFVEPAWGYNVSEEFLFLPEEENWQIDNHLLWTPDGSHLIYQHRDIVPRDYSWVDSFPNGRQIIRVDASTGDVKVLAGDPTFDFHLCEGRDSSCDRWYGDWIRVRRFPYQPQEIKYEWGESPPELCVSYGMDCEGEPDLFALNWRTGELIPWDASILPTPSLIGTPGTND